MMDNKTIAKQFIDNSFVDNDKANEVIADDIRVNWPGFAMEEIVGKQNLRNFLDNGGSDKVISQIVNNLIGEGNIVVGDGTIVTERNGKVETSHFADVYTVENRKITKLNSYMVMDQSQKSQS